MTMHFSHSPRIRRSHTAIGLFVWLAGVFPPVFLGTSELLAQQPSPSSSKTLKSRTTTVKSSWEVDFKLSQPAQVVAHFQISSETDWENSELPAVFLEILIDDRLASHLVTYMGRPFHDYAVHLGALIAGPHNLAFQRADSSTAGLKLREVRIDIYEKAHPFFSVLAHAPIIFGRSRRDASANEANSVWLDPDMRRSDVPLLLAYDEQPSGIGKTRTYTIFFSNENGGTPPPGLLHLWGRYTDIEWAYNVELDDSSKRRQAFFQGPKHRKLVYRGGFENDQPTLQIATLNNMFSDSLTTKLRFALPPLFSMPPDSRRESVMLQAPWTWQVSAKEARREQGLDPSPTDSTHIADLQRYLYIQFVAQPEKFGVKSGGFFLAKFKKQPNTYASNLWSDNLIIRSDTTIVRQTAVPLPPGTGPEDLQRLEFVANAGGGNILLTNISRLFSLDANDLPQAWKPDWQGRQRLAPGQRAIFYAEDFRLHQVYFQALPAEWHFKPDSQAMATVTSWGDKPVDEKQWPLIRIGEPWERQGYSGYDGVAWYRCQFRLDNSWQGERLWLGFGGVDDRYQVWVNGKLARDLSTDIIDADRRLTFTEITKLAQFERTNSLAVRVEDFGGEGGIVAPPVAISNFPEALAPPHVASMADPAMDREEPFDYFQKPMAILGTKDRPGFTLVTPEGYLNTGWAEIIFLGGADLAPLSCRVKSLTAEGLPIVRYRTSVDGVEYAFETFAFPAADDSLAPLFNWVRVRVQNRNNASTEAKLAVAPRFNNALHPLAAKLSFNPNWRYKVDGRLLLRDEQALMVLPEMPPVVNFSNGEALEAETPAGRLEYRWTLAPEESRTLVFSMPATPMRSAAVLAENVFTADFDRLRENAVRYWQNALNRGTQIILPERKVDAAWRANLVYLMIAGNQFNAPGTQFDHGGFDLRETALLARLLDLTGQHDLSKQILRRLWLAQAPGAMFSIALREVGPVLWAYGQHLELTRDWAFGREIYPALKKTLHALHDARQRDSWKILPAAVAGKRANHATGDNFYALLGWRYAIQIARAVGAPEDVSFFTKELEALRKAFDRRLNDATKANEGFIAPALELESGFDTGNLAAVYPSEILSPGDENVSATLERARGQFDEGLLAQSDERDPFDFWMYPDLTAYVAEAELRRGEQANVIERLYALLLHTSAAHLGCDERLRPWGDRNCPALPVSFLQPGRSGFAASLLMLVRNMLLREHDRELHLLSAVSPAWIKTGEKISVQNAVTNFGKVSFVAEVIDNGMVIDFSTNWQTSPQRLVLHFPYFAKVERIVADGRRISLEKDRAHLSSQVRRVEIYWQNQAERQRLSFAATVEDFKREYRKRYQLLKVSKAATAALPAPPPEKQ
ncbi:hypothetical protein L0337_32995 [candidate division KSB1 bacterium]|nr:hypothetical protein [candidate division KSB1 bacterium]